MEMARYETATALLGIDNQWKRNAVCSSCRRMDKEKKEENVINLVDCR